MLSAVAVLPLCHVPFVPSRVLVRDLSDYKLLLECFTVIFCIIYDTRYESQVSEDVTFGVIMSTCGLTIGV